MKTKNVYWIKNHEGIGEYFLVQDFLVQDDVETRIRIVKNIYQFINNPTKKNHIPFKFTHELIFDESGMLIYIIIRS